MTWLFDTDVRWESWMMYIIVVSNLLYVIAYTIAPLCLLFYHMYRGEAFLLPKWLTFFIIVFMIVTCVSRLNHILIFQWPALHYIVLVEAIGGLTSLAAIFVLPYIVKLAAHVPSTHKMHNLEHENGLYKKLDKIQMDRVRITGNVILNRLQSNVPPKIYNEIKNMVETLSA